MDIKKWLNRAYKIDMQIRSKEEQIEAWRELASKTTTSYGGVGGGSGVNNKVENYCTMIADAQAELEKGKEKLVMIKHEIERAILLVDDVAERVLLEQRYLLEKTWEDISEVMGYQVDYIRKELYFSALEHISLLVPPETPLFPHVDL